MQSIDTSTWLSQAAVEKLGWVLVHSFWQLTAVALLAWLFDRALRRRTSSVRYLSLLFALLLMIASPVVTWLMLPASPVDPVSAAKPDSASIARDTPAQTANQEPAAPIEIVEVTTTGSLDKPVATSASSGHWMNRCAEFLTPWLGTIVSVWSFGVLMFSVRPVVSWINVQRLKRRGTSAVAESVQQTLAMLSQKLQVRQRVDVLISTVVTSPIVVGCFRSVILLPASFIAGVPPAQLEAILAHELAHVKRYDYFVNLIQTLVETLSFYHPAVWWLSHRIRIERENCCDDMVVTALNNKVVYGKALLAVEEYRANSAVLALSARGGSLLARVRRILSVPPDDAGHGSASVLVSACLLLCTLIGLSWSAVFAGNAEAAVKASDEQAAKEPSGSVESPSSFSAVLSEKLSVELLAIHEHRQQTENDPKPAAPPTPVWRGNGEVYAVPPELPAWNDTAHQFAERTRHILFQCKGLSEDQAVACRVDGVRLFTNPDDAGFVRAIVEPSESASTASVKLGVTDAEWGPWVKVDLEGQEQEDVEIPAACRDVYNRIGVSHVNLRGNESWFVWIGLEGVDDTAQAALVAVDKSGKRHRSVGSTAEGSPPNPLSVDIFNVPLEELDHFEFRLRPFRYWVTFEDVSLEPGQRTTPRVKVESVPVANSKAESQHTRTRLISDVFARYENLAQVYADKRKAATEKQQRIAIIVAKPDSQQADWFYSLLQGTDDDLKRWKVDESAIKEIRQGLSRFQLLWVDAAQFDELRRLIPDHEFEDQHESSMVFLESDGSWLCHFEPDPTKEPRRSLENLGSAVDLHKEGKKNAGKLQGRIHLDGQAPRLTPATIPPGAVGNAKRMAFVDGSLLVGEKNGLANAFVYLKKAPTGWNPPTETESGTMVKVTPTGFSPRASILQVGHDLTIDNTLTVMANTVLMPIKNQPYNIGIAPTKRELLKSPIKKRESLPFRLKSDIHPWMEGYVLALDHPFAAVSDSAGGFHIDNLPPGEHEFSVWHERVGFLKPVLVQIKGNETSTVDLPVSSDAFKEK